MNVLCQGIEVSNQNVLMCSNESNCWRVRYDMNEFGFSKALITRNEVSIWNVLCVLNESSPMIAVIKWNELKKDDCNKSRK
jgi:hypothetical protein